MTVLLDADLWTPPVAQPHWAWRSGPHTALGHRFEVCSEVSLDLAAVLGPILAPFRGCDFAGDSQLTTYTVQRTPDGDAPFTMFVDGIRLATGRTGQDFVSLFTWHINQQVIAKTSPHAVLLHASAAVRGGLTVILPADQESGKTTTLAGLLREGFDYVTDEAVCIRPEDGWVTPFPKNLSVDVGSQHLCPECAPSQLALPRQWQVPAHMLGAKALHRPVPPPRVVLFPKYTRGVETTVIRVSRAQAVREMALMTFGFRLDPTRNLSVLGSVARQAVTARLQIGDLDSAVRCIEGLISQVLLEEL